jgi:hypothetical protein
MGEVGLSWWSLEDSDEWEVAVFLCVIKSVTDDKGVGYAEAGVVDLDWVGAVDAFFQEDADSEAAGFVAAEFFEQSVEGLAGIEDIVDEEDVSVLDIGGEFFGELEMAGLGLAAVAGGADEVEGEGEAERADEVGGEDDGAVEDGDDDGIFVLVVVLDGAGEGFDAAGKSRGGDKDGLD